MKKIDSNIIFIPGLSKRTGEEEDNKRRKRHAELKKYLKNITNGEVLLPNNLLLDIEPAEKLKKDILLLIEKTKEYIIVGHSLGGILAIDIAKEMKFKCF